jgi:hypothetical protein
VIENGVLKIFGPKRDEITGDCRRLNNEERRDLYSSPNIIVIKSRRMRWASYVARTRDRRDTYRFMVGRPERDNLDKHGRR